MTDVKKVPVSEEIVEVDETIEEVEEVTPEDVTPEATELPKAGDKTEPNKLLKSLQAEREKRRALEEELEQLKSSVPSDDEEDYEDDTKLKQDLVKTNARLSQLEREQELSKVLADNPVLAGKEADFAEFLEEEENSKISVSRVAKLFIAEKGLS